MALYTKYEILLEKINLIFKELEDSRQSVLRAEPQSKKEGEQAWNNLMKLSDEISARWQGPPAVEEIRYQRSKGY